MTESGLRIEGNTLYVTRELRQDFDLPFDQCCNELLDQPFDNLVIDLGDVGYINSSYIGMIAATYFQAQGNDKTLKLIAHGHVLKILRSAGFDGYIQLEEAVKEN